MVRRMLRTYAAHWRVGALATLEYRTNALLWFGFVVVYHGSALATIWLVLGRFPSMNGWNFREMAFLYALWMVAHAFNLFFFGSISDVPGEVQDGEFDRYLVRPLDPLFGVLASPGAVFPDELLLALATFAVATWYAGIVPSVPFVVETALVVLGGSLIGAAIDLLVATLSFWFVRVGALSWLALQLESEFTRYPLGIYAKPVRWILTFVLPFAFMNYFPAAYFLGKDGATFGLPLAVGLATPLIGLAFGAVAYSFWRVGLNHYQGVGH